MVTPLPPFLRMQAYVDHVTGPARILLFEAAKTEYDASVVLQSRPFEEVQVMAIRSEVLVRVSAQPRRSNPQPCTALLHEDSQSSLPAFAYCTRASLLCCKPRPWLPGDPVE